MTPSQEKLFIASEGNAYFKRNEPAMLDKKSATEDAALKLIEAEKLNPAKVLEIGCGA